MQSLDGDDGEVASSFKKAAAVGFLDEIGPACEYLSEFLRRRRDAAKEVEKENEAREEGMPSATENVDQIVRIALESRRISPQKLEGLSPEARRNVAMAFWRVSEKLTPAKIRDRWIEWHLQPGLPTVSRKKHEDKNRRERESVHQEGSQKTS